MNPTATTAQVTTVIEGAYAGLDSANVTDLDIEPGTDANGAAFADLSMRYDIDLQFVLFQLENIELEANRRVFLQL